MILSYRITVILLRNIYDEIEAIDVELIRIEEDHKDSIDKLVDSIQQYADSITLNLDIQVDENTDSIKELADSISDLDNSLSGEIDLLKDEKVDRAGDTMTGELVFDPYGIVGAQDGQNVYLEPTETFINTPLTCRNGLMVMGDVIETNDDYVAETDNDIVDVKSLVGNDSIEGLNLVINEPVTKTLPSDGGYLFRSTSNPGRIGYRPSIPLKPAAQVALTSLAALPTDSVDADDLRDILVEFFTYIEDTGVLNANDQVVYEAD